MLGKKCLLFLGLVNNQIVTLFIFITKPISLGIGSLVLVGIS